MRWSLLIQVGCLSTTLWSSVAMPQNARGAQPPQAADLMMQAVDADRRGDYATAERLCSEALQRDGNLDAARYYRGRARFCLGKFAQSVKDFDTYIEVRPASASRQWERGIACYYAGQFEKGAAQFKLYQTYHDNDVENSVWRFLCMARQPEVGVLAAQKAMLPIRNDRRVPMMQIYELYRGRMEPDEVMAAIGRDDPSEEVRSGRLFYARLYLGLWHEANGRPRQAREQIQLAAEKHAADAKAGRINAFMWAVAVQHWNRLKPSSDPPERR